MIDNNSMYVRYDAIGNANGTGATAAYYGYINTLPNQTQTTSSDSSAVFSLKKTYWVGNSQYTAWSNNVIGSYECDWTNRISYFATPSAVTTVTATYSFDGWKNNIRFSWTMIPGVSRYAVNIYGGANYKSITYLQDAMSSAVNNPENKSSTMYFINTNSCTIQNVATGSTYTIIVQPSNGFGTCTASTTSIGI
jgi:hypothetical protein